VTDTEDSDPKIQQFEFPFGYKELRSLMQVSGQLKEEFTA